eukprot:1160625-Pelagomonas_calceolata.AAC.5
MRATCAGVIIEWVHGEGRTRTEVHSEWVREEGSAHVSPQRGCSKGIRNVHCLPALAHEGYTFGDRYCPNISMVTIQQTSAHIMIVRKHWHAHGHHVVPQLQMVVKQGAAASSRKHTKVHAEKTGPAGNNTQAFTTVQQSRG